MKQAKVDLIKSIVLSNKNLQEILKRKQRKNLNSIG